MRPSPKDQAHQPLDRSLHQAALRALGLSLSSLCLALSLSACADSTDELDGATPSAGATEPDERLDAGPPLDQNILGEREDMGGGMDEGAFIQNPPDPLPPSPEEVIASLIAPGPHQVGYQTEEISYEAPSLDGEEAETRSLKLAWWYPSADQEGSLAPYGLGPRSTRVGLGGASVLEELSEAPVLIFSHGNSGIPEQSYFLTEHFASHGWVVLAVEHRGNTLSDMSEPMYRLFELRPLDVSAALDHLEALPSEHPLAGRVSGSDWALAGHSFGGYTTLAVGGGGYQLDELLALCQDPPEEQREACAYTIGSQERYRAGFSDPRLKALIPMTPVGAELFGGERGLRQMNAPVMMMTAGLDLTLPNHREGDPLWAALDQPEGVRVDFTHAGHFSFSNACEIAMSLLESDGCGERFTPYLELHALINLYALAFAELHVLGRDWVAPVARGDVLPPQAAGLLTISLKSEP